MPPAISYVLISMNRSIPDSAYLDRLDNRIKTLVETPNSSIRGIIRECQGAFPTIVYDRLEQLNLLGELSTGDTSSVNSSSHAAYPELHPLDFEWYFTDSTTNAIAKTLRNQGEPVLCLGTPTVAFCLAKQGISVVLVDRNSLIKERFDPENENLTFLTEDLNKSLEINEKFPVAFFDSPWYSEYTYTWLYRASEHIQRHGQMHFVLFPQLVRPSAIEQRKRLIHIAQQLGVVSIEEGSVTYKTPEFELEVLQNSEIPVIQDWRRADLVNIEVNTPNALSPPPAEDINTTWDTFVISGQVVKVRKNISTEGTTALFPIEGSEGYVFTSVSRRDARRQSIDLWTSRNRVAAVGDRAIVVEALQYLEDGMDLLDLYSTKFTNSDDDSRKREMVAEMTKILR